MSIGNFKHELFSQFARIAKAMSNAYRLELLEFLAQGERSVDALAQVSGLTVANTSQHLQQLRQAGLVVNRKEGHKVYYRLSGMDVSALLGSLREVAERRLADVSRLVDDYLKVKDSLEPVPAAQLLERVRDGLVTVLDVRPPEEYAAGHLPGAINIPLEEMSDGYRLELLEFLAQGERSVDALAQVSGLTVANTSQHLQQLRQAGLVVNRKEGHKVYYRLSGMDVSALLGSLREVAERRLADVSRLVDDYLKVKDSLEPVPAAQLLERVRDGLVTVLDVRPPEEYAAGHLPGAINIPLEDLEQRLDELDPDQEIVAYCRGPHCVLAFDAVSRLRQKGVKARRLEGGLPEWQLEGLPVETT